jgi:hypothetical protein
MADVIELIDDTLDTCVRRGSPAVALYLTDDDRRSVQDHKVRFPVFADACVPPTLDDARERYLHVPIERSTADFSYAVVNVWHGQLLHRRVRIDAPESAF